MAFLSKHLTRSGTWKGFELINASGAAKNSGSDPIGLFTNTVDNSLNIFLKISAKPYCQRLSNKCLNIAHR